MNRDEKAMAAAVDAFYKAAAEMRRVFIATDVYLTGEQIRRVLAATSEAGRVAADSVKP
jgi:predicted transcriptional regulator